MKIGINHASANFDHTVLAEVISSRWREDRLMPHALAPVAELPVLEVVAATHIVADLTLGLGRVVHDYLH
jgi:acetoacetate decarboxylase